MKLKDIYDGRPVTQRDILECRSLRAERQRRFVENGCAALISFSMNIPGPIKRFSLTCSAFQVGLKEIRNAIKADAGESEIYDADTGPEALISCSLSPENVKRAMIRIEDYHPLGRLFDIDVIAGDGKAISRSALGIAARSCLVCGENAKICARSSAHSLDSLQYSVARILNDFFRGQGANRCIRCATKAMLYEVSVTPKPGLVDRNNTGSHSDMDYFSFLDSSAALAPWFYSMFCAGWDWSGKPLRDLFEKTRFLGRKAEADMFRATGGVNTHKGLVFSLGLLCSAMGYVQAACGHEAGIKEILAVCAEMGTCSLEDFTNSEAAGGSNGMECFLSYGIRGVREEAALGFPSAVNIGLPSIEKWMNRGMNVNDASVMTLLELIAGVADTNMIHRGGYDLALQAKAEAAALLNSIDEASPITALTELDKEYIKNNLSPGGCADILALSLMLYFLTAE